MSNINLHLNPFKLLFFFLIISLSYQALPPEKDFKVLSSRELSYFELTKSKSEAYYSFNNQHPASDIVVNFRIAKGFTTYCYIYDSYSNIKQNDNGQYINALKEFRMTEKSVILKSSELTIKQGKYYFVIKDKINSYNKDYISIFNENDVITLVNEHFIQFDQFYSKNVFHLTFSLKKNEIATLQLNIDNTDFLQMITVTTDKNEIVYMGEVNRGEIKLNEDLDTEGKYIVEIESEEEPYTEMKSSIVLHIDERKSKELLYDKPLSLSYNGNKDFSFYINLSEYDLNEENIVTFKFGEQLKERRLLSHCNAKLMNLETNDDNKIIANMPVNDEENEAVFALLTGTDDVYQLYFKNTLEKEENKTTYLLIHLSIQVNLYDTEDFVEPEEFSVYLSNKPEKIDLIEYKDKTHLIYNKNIKLKNYVPIIYKIQLPLEEQALPYSYVFYTSDSIQTIYNTSMLLCKHKHEKKRMLYAISPSQSEYEYTKVLYIKIYGFSSGEINFRIESTESNVYYIHNDYRKLKTFSNKLTDCSKSFYYIGDYGPLVLKGYFYQETLFGKINTYYKGKILPEDKSILMNHDSSYLIDSLFPLETSIDIVELKCEAPGYYQAHLVDFVDQRNINLYSKIYNYLPAKKNFTITPILSPNQEDINFEIYNPIGKSMKISDGEKIINLDNKNKFYQIKYQSYSNMPQKFTVLSDEDNIISITMTNKNSFIIVDKDRADIDYDSQIIIKLPQKDYSTVNVVITRIYHGFSYSLFRGNVDYAGKLIESEYDYIPADNSHKINMIISNPYLIKPNEKYDDENDGYYLMYSIDDPELIQKEVRLSYKPIEDHEIINPQEIKTIPNENNEYNLPASDISIVFQSCENSLKQILIKDLGENIIQEIPDDSDNKYNYKKVNNYGYKTNMNIHFKNSEKDVDPNLKGAVIGVSEKEITEERINYYTNLKLKIKIVKEKGHLEWETIDQMKNYDIYVLDENNSYIPHLNNPCLLQVLKNNFSSYSLQSNDTSYIKHYSKDTNSISLNEQGIYIITITSKIENDIPLLYIYEPFIYNSSIVPPPPPSDDEGKDDEEDNSDTLLFLGIALPIVVIGVLILIFSLIKCRKKKDDGVPEISENTDDKNEAIVRDTITSTVST